MSANPFSSFLAPARATAPGSVLPSNGLSYVRGDPSAALQFRTIPQLFEDTVQRFGSRPAAIFCEHNVRWNWHDLKDRVDAFAAGLLALGVERGDRVGIWAPNVPEWIVTQFATARIGAVLVNINPAYRVTELEYALNKVGCKVLVLAARHKSSNYVEMLQSLAPELGAGGALSPGRLPSLRTVILIGGEHIAGMLGFAEVEKLAGPSQRQRLAGLTAQLDPDDSINIQFTSGTTGFPKGATLSHYNIVNNARYSALAMGFSEIDRLCVPVPLYHCFGMVLAVLACTACGACLVFPGQSFEPKSTLAAVATERCTALHGVPAMFIAELNEPDFKSYDLSALRTGIMAGAPCPVEVMRRVVSEMHMHEVTIAYGMTETSPVSFQSAVNDPLERRVSTVGRVQPHLEVKVVDEQGRIVPLGRSGELCTRGYSVMLGYWDDEARTAEVLDKAGWMHTGDLATLDAQGYCNIVGRVKDMLIRGGENVFPREIEEYLYRHPKVLEAQVFGVPDPKLGEEVCAWLVLKPGASASEDEIKDFCRGQIAHYKIPRYVRFVKELPKTVTGKAQKFAMRDAMVRELGVSNAKTA